MWKNVWWVVLVLLLSACGTEEQPGADRSTKSIIPSELSAKYDIYVEALRAGDAERLAEVNADGAAFTEQAVAAARTRGVVPGDIVASWVSEDEEIAYFVHDMRDESGESLPNRMAKIALWIDGEWKLVVTPRALNASELAELGTLLLGSDAGDYFLNEEANNRLAAVPEADQEAVFNRVNAQSDYSVYEANNALVGVLFEWLSVEENQTVLAEYFANYHQLFTERTLKFGEIATEADDVRFMERIEPWKQELDAVLSEYEPRLVEPTFG